MSLKEIIVIGSLHYDIFLESPDLPRIGETIKGKDWHPKLGGKGGNQAIAASLYPVPTKLISAIGNDDFANYILENLKQTNINTSYIQRLQNYNSGMSVAISNDEGDYGAVIVSGANLHINTEVFDETSLWEKTGILMVQNEIDDKTNILAAKKAKEMGVRIFYNAAPAKKINPDFYGLVDMLLVNEIEAQDITAIKITNLDDIKKTSKFLSKNFPVAIVSAGQKGVVYCENQKEPIHIKETNVKVKSTHGAGDTFAGTFCGALISGKDLQQSISIANRKAADFISK